MASRISYPAIYESADRCSMSGQERFVTATRLRLGALAAAALGGAASWIVGRVDIFGWLALVAFATALAAETYILSQQPERLWYEGRAAAESAKTLAWRYAVGGDPFPVDLPPSDADQLLLARLDEVLEDLDHLSVPAPEGNEGQITSSMRALRSSAFDDRRAAYLRDRVIDQQDWYSSKAEQQERYSRLFTVLALTLEFAGLIGATLKAFNVVSVDLLGLLSAVAAGITAWIQARHYAFNSSAYSIASQELASIRSELDFIDESLWSRYVEEAEEAISREHTLWRASRGIAAKGRIRRARRAS